MQLDPNIPALSIRQPWAICVAHGIKPVENRTRRTRYRGKFYIHASGTYTQQDYLGFFAFVTSMSPRIRPEMVPVELMEEVPHQVGGIIGEAELVDCINVYSHRVHNPWFTGPYGWVIANAKPLPFVPCKGKLGFFKPKIKGVP